MAGLSEAFEALGARYRVVVDDDATVVAATVLSTEAGAALDLLADVIQRPTLPAAELDRLRARKLLALGAEADLPHVLHLAGERGVPVEPVEGLPYTCVGLIQPHAGGEG